MPVNPTIHYDAFLSKDDKEYLAKHEGELKELLVHFALTDADATWKQQSGKLELETNWDPCRVVVSIEHKVREGEWIWAFIHKDS